MRVSRVVSPIRSAIRHKACAAGLVLGFILLSGCAGPGNSTEQGQAASTSPQVPQGATSSGDQNASKSNDSDGAIPVNHQCACNDLVDAGARGAFPVVINESVKLQSNCVYYDGTNKDHYLSISVYSGSKDSDFDGAVRRARTGYEKASELRSEDTSDGLSAKWFSGDGSKSRVIGTVVFNRARGVIVEAREIRLGSDPLTLPEHVAPAAARAGNQAAWVCRKP